MVQQGFNLAKMMLDVSLPVWLMWHLRKTDFVGKVNGALFLIHKYLLIKISQISV